MLEAIKKFVLERGRDLRQSKRRVAEDDEFGQPPLDPEGPPQAAEPELVEEPSEPSVRARVKWFNPNKRYGFVELLDGSGDAFLHATVLRRIGVDGVHPGTTLDCGWLRGSEDPRSPKSSAWTALLQSRPVRGWQVLGHHTIDRILRRASTRPER